MKFGKLGATAAAVFFGVMSASAVTAPAKAGQTLDAIKQKKFVQCGVSTGVAGYSAPDSKGEWHGIDADICRAVAIAMFGDPNAVKFTPLSAQQRFTAIQSGEIDILSRQTTWTLTRDTQAGLTFAPVIFYDGQGFLVKKSLGIKTAAELNGATVCVQTGTTTEQNLADFFRKNKIAYTPVVIEQVSEVQSAFFSGRCDAMTDDSSGLASTRSVAKNPDDYEILPDRISKEPLAPAVRKGDDQWFDIVKWTVFALIQAEEFGLTSANVDEGLKSEDPDIKRFLGVTPGMGAALGVDEKWAYNIVKKLGNYGEVFEKNLGKASALKLDRGYNDLWTKKGLMYAMPFR